MDWETYQTAYQNATPQLRELLDSELIPNYVRSALESRGLITLRKSATVQISGYVLGVQTIDETIKNLTQLGVPGALQFLAEIQAGIDSKTLPTQQPVSAPFIKADLETEIFATERDIQSLQGVRTMAQDMKEAKVHPITPHTTTETTHQSSQADLLRQIESLATPSSVPRWDTEK